MPPLTPNISKSRPTSKFLLYCIFRSRLIISDCGVTNVVHAATGPVSVVPPQLNETRSIYTGKG